MRAFGGLRRHLQTDIARWRVYRRPVISSTAKSPFRAHRTLFTNWTQAPPKPSVRTSLTTTALATAIFIWWLYPTDGFKNLRDTGIPVGVRRGDGRETGAEEGDAEASDFEWSAVPDKLVDFIVPDWAKYVPGYLRKLQAEISMTPGSLAEEIWQEARDPDINPEIRYSARVRVSNDLCDEEKEFRARRKKVTAVALARYLGLDETEIHPDDVPIIAVCGSGGGLRALVAGTGSLLSTYEDGLFDCVTYTAGVSGSCWLQAIYNSSIAGGNLHKVLDHLRNRLGVHIADPPIALRSLVTAPTNKYLLNGAIEKLQGDTGASFGIVDLYGMLLAARLLVPKGELGVDPNNFKLSNQREHIQYGQNPLPIYTAVRHEIPEMEGANVNGSSTGVSDEAKDRAKQEAWFQWFEITPYEFFCEEFSAGIPTWALGRQFKDGVDVTPESGVPLPEIRTPLLLGIFGSAFCATLSHYYNEVRPILRNMAGFAAIDEMITGRNDDLSKVHPIDPAMVSNFAYGMQGQLAETTPRSLYENKHIQLMDAGMSNNLPFYPLLRPGREIDIIIAFDASADIKTDNWLSVTDGYARQRGIKGWPIGIGWPKNTSTQVEKALDKADSTPPAQPPQNPSSQQSPKSNPSQKHPDDLGYCTIWVGTTQDRTTTSTPPPSKAITSSTSWQITAPDAGLAVIYLPLLTNPSVPGVDPASTSYLSTWNFIYTPEQIDSVVRLARANYLEGRDQIRECVRAVYERRRRGRIAGEGRRSEVGDHFS